MRLMILAAVAALAFASAADAKTCKDAAGKYVKCPAAAAAPAAAPAPAKATKKEAKKEMKAANKANAQMPASAKQCKDAKGKFVACPAAAAAPAAKPAAAAKPVAKPAAKMAAKAHAGPDKCKKGKPCGNACIPMDKVCHK